MAVRGGRWWWVAGVVVSAVLALGGLAWFLARQHLDRADKWSSVIGMFVGVIGLLISVYSLIHDRRSTRPAPLTPQPSAAPVEPAGVPGPDTSVKSTISGGQFHGPVLMGRDMRRVSLTGTPVPAAPEPDPAASPAPESDVDASGVENRVENATMAGPLLMGRDMTDIVLPPHTPPVVPPGTAPQREEGTGR